MKKLLFAATIIIAFASCRKEDQNKYNIFKGPEVSIHDGKAFTWVQLDKSGRPERLGITLNEDVLNSLPADDQSGGGHHQHSNNIVLPLHQKASAATPFKHIGVDWNPIGHEPEGVYTRAHFDFHFYMITQQERAAIPPYEVDSLKFKNLPAAAYMPPTYVAIPGGVPQMGTHWIDFTSPELDPVNPAIFTQTFIYGSYNGKVTFYEPMITLDFIRNTTSFERAIPQPAKFQQTGYYPSKMRVIRHEGLTQIVLEDFTYRQQS
jgi:hypothetical protein